MSTEKHDQMSAATAGCAAAAGYAPEPRATLIRLVVIKPYTRRAIGLWAPIGSHTRSSKIMNHRLGRKRAWTFRTKSAHTDQAHGAAGGGNQPQTH